MAPNGARISIPPPTPHRADREADLLRSAFRDVHGPRLHGFALLVALGDRAAAERAAARALAVGGRQVDGLRHPERAAAWLRREVVRRLGSVRSLAGPDDADRRAALAALGCRPAAIDGLAALSQRERAAYVAAAVERFEPMDVELICERSPAAVRRLVARARDRYLATSVTIGQASEVPQRGRLRDRVWEAAGRAMGPMRARTS